ncbi:MAG: hypothetical protein SFV23_19615 [Planctomycetaceae bacterium]|nr:hypothetical protein [Planctomycetaceae bacterium]
MTQNMGHPRTQQALQHIHLLIHRGSVGHAMALGVDGRAALPGLAHRTSFHLETEPLHGQRDSVCQEQAEFRISGRAVRRQIKPPLNEIGRTLLKQGPSSIGCAEQPP